MLKTAVCKFREKPKDSYDIYYYCRYSEEPSVIRQRLAEFATEPAVRATIDSLRRMFSHADSKWVEMALDHMRIIDVDARDQEARLIVRAIGQIIP